ncbi:MAG TPA: hypothetical protein VL025_05185 [Thermoanaerobaculia bacterium]|nr:hypothetical protein [Thermoanaerobaculia bacterium]
MVQDPELWAALTPVVEALEALGVPYHLGGSVASSFTGISRATQDADLVADLHPHHATFLAATLQQKGYYADSERVEQGIQARRSFNVIHLPTMYKIDVFVSQDTPFARENMARRIEIDIPSLGRSFCISSPEDIVLHKLLWYREGGGVSDRQWYDLQGVLRLQGPNMDLTYLRSWAKTLEVSEALERALAEAGSMT